MKVGITSNFTHIILYCSDWSRIRPLPSTTFNKEVASFPGARSINRRGAIERALELSRKKAASYKN